MQPPCVDTSENRIPDGHRRASRASSANSRDGGDFGLHCLSVFPMITAPVLDPPQAVGCHAPAEKRVQLTVSVDRFLAGVGIEERLDQRRINDGSAVGHLHAWRQKTRNVVRRVAKSRALPIDQDESIMRADQVAGHDVAMRESPVTVGNDIA